MTLKEFVKLVKENVDLFAEDYMKQRSEAPDPDESHPLEGTSELWFDDLYTWIRIFKLMGGLDIEPIAQDDEEVQSSVEFTFDHLEEK